jgi:hypothetical protein
MTGQRFTRLVVLERQGSDVSKKNSTWKCRCDCGMEIVVSRTHLRSGHTKSCGCYRIDEAKAKLPSMRPKKLELGEASFNALFSSYKRQAYTRGRGFDLGVKEFRALITSNCHYCDAAPNNIKRNPGYNGEFIYTGIDRIDSKLGYTPDNVVPCCIVCNRAKHVLGINDFEGHIIKMATTLLRKEAARTSI